LRTFIMKHHIVVGIEHQVAPHFILHALSDKSSRISIVADNARSADTLFTSLHMQLGESAGEPLQRLAVIDANADQMAAEGDARYLSLYLFLSRAQIAALLDGIDSESAGLPLPGRSILPRTVHIVTDRHHFPVDRSVAHCLEKIEQALRPRLPANADLHSYCLGPCIDDSHSGHGPERMPAPPLEALADQVISLLFDIRRRAPEYFSRYPLRLALRDCGPLRLMPTRQAAEFLATSHGASTQRHLVYGTQICSMENILAAIAHATQADIQVLAADDIECADQASAILRDDIGQLINQCRRNTEDAETIRAGTLQLHELAAEPVELSIAVKRVLKARENENRTMQRRFSALPGLLRKAVPERGLHYSTCGSGPEVLLIVNAFGLSLDFWQMLVGSLSTSFKIIALDRDEAEDIGGISRTCYSGADYANAYVADVVAVLRAEEINRCHVASWCSGAKLAMELAHAIPVTVKSLSFIAPSFAGVDGFMGCDSAYEKNLFTMCKIVNQMPKAAAQMANSMMAIMNKSSNDLERFQKGSKDAVDVLELADSQHLPLLYRPFASAENLVEFSRQLMHFRSHDITPRLNDAHLQLPVMLITGRTDTTTSSVRAGDICQRLPNIVGVEIAGGSHYLIHQNYQIVAELMSAFIRDGIDLSYTNPRVERAFHRQAEEMVCGEL
jgi:pimeloyl-ACP methyl ester carboxylesterase